MNKDRSKKIKDIVQKSIEERTKILGKRHYGHFVNEDEDKKKKDKKGKKPHHGVPPPPPSVNSPFENAISASYGGTEEGGALSVTADQDATDFILYAGITDPTQQLAIEDLVSNLKAAELWDKFYCLYPLVGNIADTMKWNLKDPRDEDDAFRITWDPCGGAGITFSSTGVQIDPIPSLTMGAGPSISIGDTHFRPKTDQDDEASGFYMIYSRTPGITQNQRFALGSYTDPGSPAGYLQMYDTTNFVQHMAGSNSGTIGGGYVMVTTNFPSSDGMISLSRTSSTDFRAYHNGAQDGATATREVGAGEYSDNTVYLLSRHVGAACASSWNCGAEAAFMAMGDGLDSDEVADLYAIIQDFQTTLGREV